MWFGKKNKKIVIIIDMKNFLTINFNNFFFFINFNRFEYILSNINFIH